ncbi:MAG TPA: 50S ribosomal protein L4 [Aquifex aeolicus]|uniref:Large ribosomal subunit protein uL4 n=1 Tax=Aquifex aeolicus TaxID=63363 RepID=A0A9D0YRY7_AQUAO|nr:50S ribosomal protein L4 [Aquifex aeolicus]
MEVKKVEVQFREDIFNVPVKKHVLWEVVKWQLAKRRAGTHSTKTRGEVAYSGRKLLPQKGTGNARHGDRGAPIFVGGGIAHGPKPRDYSYNLNKKIRRKALKMALSDRAREGNITVVEDFGFEKPKTKQAVAFLKSLGLENQKVLIIIPEKDENIHKSFRNLPNVIVLPAEGLNVYDILWANHLVITKNALQKIEERLAK